MRWTRANTRLRETPAGRPGGPVVFAAAGRLAAPAGGRFTPDDPAAGGLPPVRLVPRSELADDELAVPADTAVALAAGGGWTLDAVPVVPLAELRLEPVADAPLADAVRWLEQAADLHGLLIAVPPGHARAGLPVFVGGRAYLAAGLVPDPGPAGGLMTVTADTRVEVRAAAARVGVDAVILADCSASMNSPDLVGPAGPVQRMTALKRALHRLIDGRVAAAGRASRFALVGFHSVPRQVFPDAGLAEVGPADPAAVARFRAAVDALAVETVTGTDIGQAVHAAGELLRRHAGPDADRLVVLLSDGADAPPRKGIETTGELLAGLADPVAALAHERADRPFDLHAVGIGSPAAFAACWRTYYAAQKKGPPPPSLVPNHELLRRLAAVAGGRLLEDRDAGQLADYFTGLGAGGAGRPVRVPAAPPPAPTAAEVAGWRPARPADPDRADRDRLAADVIDLGHKCDEVGCRIGEGPVFDTRALRRTLHDRLSHLVTNQLLFESFVNILNKAVFDSLTDRLRVKRDAAGKPLPQARPYPVPEAVELLGGSELSRRLTGLRNDVNHNKAASDKNKRELKAVGDLYEELVGKRWLEEDDAVLRGRAQLGVLRWACELLTAVHAALDAYRGLPPEPPIVPPAAAPPAGRFAVAEERAAAAGQSAGTA